jgi:hypothetical protein
MSDSFWAITLCRPSLPIWDDAAFLRRFDAKVRRQPGGCWTWTGTAVRDGRGTIKLNGSMVSAPRIAKVIADRAWAADDVFACHSCDNPSCVNPAHIWWGTAGDNIRDAATKGRRIGRPPRSHCAMGHALTGDNLRMSRGHKVCRACAIDRQKKWRTSRCCRTVAAIAKGVVA